MIPRYKPLQTDPFRLLAAWMAFALWGGVFTRGQETPADPGAPREEDDELPYVSPPPPPLPDFRKLEIDKVIRLLLADSGLPARRQVRLRRMAGGAYQAGGFRPFWEGANPDIVLERISDGLRSHALDPFAIPGFAGSPGLPSGTVPKTDKVTVDDIRLTIQVAEAALLLKEGPATELLIWQHWNQGDTPGTIASAIHTENVTRTFAAALGEHAHEPERILDEFIPRNWIYERLRDAWLATIANPNPEPITFTGNASRGRRFGQTAELTSLLSAAGFLSPEDAEDAAARGIITDALSLAIRDFQRANGLRVDGILGPRTIARMKRDPNRDRQRIVLNLHRARLIPNDRGRRHVLVNLPSAELFCFEEENLELQMRIVFGRNSADRRTPIFRDTIEQVIFRPYWWVPTTIAVTEYLPRAYRDPSYLSRRGYEIVNGSTRMRISSRSLAGVASGAYTLRQRSGYGNSLGLVKFRFPNDHAVYFHDTPQKSLFNHSRRDYSHGCMRLHQPAEMANWILEHDPDWNASSIKRAMSHGDRTIVPLEEPVHVFVVYFTVFPLPDREHGLAFLDDVYGRDMPSLENLLAASAR